MRANQEKTAPLTPARSELSIPRSFYKIVHLCKKSTFFSEIYSWLIRTPLSASKFVVLMYQCFLLSQLLVFVLQNFVFLISCLSDYFFRNMGGPTPPSSHPQLYEFYVSIKEVNRESEFWFQQYDHLDLPEYPQPKWMLPWKVILVVVFVVCMCGDRDTIGWKGESLDNLDKRLSCYHLWRR